MSSVGVDFKNKWVLLSGATSGLGSSIAVMLAKYNARLVLLGRDEKRLTDLRDRLPSKDHQILVLDLNNIDEIKAKLQPVLSRINPIYGLCHCAGVVITRSLGMSKPDVIQKQLDVNVLAGIELARLVSSREYASHDEGSIVFVSSIYSQVGAPGQIGYCLSKGAVNSAVRAMATELAPRKIKVNSISPGFIKTEMTLKKSNLSDIQIQEIINKHPLGAGMPEDVARAVLFLLAPDNRWITGTDLIIDGGYTAQ